MNCAGRISNKAHLVGTTWREGGLAAQPAQQGGPPGQAWPAARGSAGELPASALTLTEMPGMLTGLGLQRAGAPFIVCGAPGPPLGHHGGRLPPGWKRSACSDKSYVEAL